MLRVQELDLFYGDAQALEGITLDIAQGRLSQWSGQMGRAKRASSAPSPACIDRGGAYQLPRSRYHGPGELPICNLGIGQVAEGRQMFPSLPSQENLDIGAMLPRARARRERRSRREVPALFPMLAERPGQAAGTLSGGEQQMLAIGRCLMGTPDLVMFDEPSLGLAPAIVQAVLRTIRTINQRGAHRAFWWSRTWRSR